MATNFQLANGMSLSQAKHWFKFYFDVFFDKATRNVDERRFDVFVYEKVKKKNGDVINLHEYIDIEEFKRYWAPGFHLKLVEIKQD